MFELSSILSWALRQEVLFILLALLAITAALYVDLTLLDVSLLAEGQPIFTDLYVLRTCLFALGSCLLVTSVAAPHLAMSSTSEPPRKVCFSRCTVKRASSKRRIARSNPLQNLENRLRNAYPFTGKCRALLTGVRN